MSDIDLIVLDFNGGSMLVSCLQSIADQDEKPRRVILLDNGSAVPLQEQINTPAGIEVEALRSPSNIGFTGGINMAMRHTDTPIVGWINNDVTLERAWLREMRKALEANERLAGVQSIIMGEGKTIDGAGISIDDGTFVQIGHGLRLQSLNFPSPWGVSGTAALFRAEALHAVSLNGNVLHPAFFAWYEDVELCARLREVGWEFAVVARPLAVHRGSATAARLGELGRLLRVRNRYFVHRLHRDVGRFGALVFEDLRAIVKMLTKGRFRNAVAHARAVLAGAFGKISSPLAD